MLPIQHTYSTANASIVNKPTEDKTWCAFLSEYFACLASYFSCFTTCFNWNNKAIIQTPGLTHLLLSENPPVVNLGVIEESEFSALLNRNNQAEMLQCVLQVLFSLEIQEIQLLLEIDLNQTLDKIYKKIIALLPKMETVSLNGYKAGQTPLTWASSSGNVQLATLLLHMKVNVNQTNYFSESPFSICNLDKPELINMLLEAGANVNDRNFWNDTLLEQAVEKKCPEIEQLLLQATTINFSK